MVYGLRFMVYGLWCMVYDLGFRANGSWFMVHLAHEHADFREEDAQGDAGYEPQHQEVLRGEGPPLRRLAFYTMNIYIFIIL